MKLQARNQLVLSIVLLTVSMATNIQGSANFETLNLGLSPDLGPRETRLKNIIDALKESKADFLCLQEVWMEPDLRRIIEGLEETFPFHFSSLHSGISKMRPAEELDMLHQLYDVKDNACNLKEGFELANNVSRCFQKNNCTTQNTLLGIACLTKNCKEEMNDHDVNKSCAACVCVNSVASFQGAYARCSLNSKENNRFNDAGLVIFSRKSLKNATNVDFHPNRRPSVPRGYIEAELPRGLRAVCTQLSFDLPSFLYLEYDLNFGNYSAQQRNETKTLRKNFKNKDLVLLGDFNMGPKRDGDGEEQLKGSQSKNYHALLQEGFEPCYTGKCTRCKDNPLNFIKLPNEMTSNIMVKGETLSCGMAYRYYDETDTPLSDHYGVQANVITHNNMS